MSGAGADLEAAVQALWAKTLGRGVFFLDDFRADAAQAFTAYADARVAEAVGAANRRVVEALVVEKQRASYRGPGDSSMLAVTNALERIEAAIARRAPGAGGGRSRFAGCTCTPARWGMTPAGHPFETHAPGCGLLTPPPEPEVPR